MQEKMTLGKLYEEVQLVLLDIMVGGYMKIMARARTQQVLPEIVMIDDGAVYATETLYVEMALEVDKRCCAEGHYDFADWERIEAGEKVEALFARFKASAEALMPRQRCAA